MIIDDQHYDVIVIGAGHAGTEAAMAASTKREGSCTTCNAAKLKVSECAKVNAVTIFSTFRNAARD